MTFCLHHWLLSAQVSLDQVDSATLQRLLQRFAVQHKSWADTAVSVWCTSFPDRLHLDAARVAAVRSSIGAQVAVRRSSSQKRATATNRTTANALQLCYSCATILLQSCYSLGTLVLQSCYSRATILATVSARLGWTTGWIQTQLGETGRCKNDPLHLKCYIWPYFWCNAGNWS